MKKYLLLIILLIMNIRLTIGKTNSLNITIFFTNDTNGHPLQFTEMEDPGQGGIPARYALINKIKIEKKLQNILILDSGGIICGQPESNLYNGLIDIEGMNKIGYYASGVGIAEIRDSLKKFQTLNNKADFYFLNANIKLNQNRNNDFCDRYIIKKIGGLEGIKIGLFAVITDEAITQISSEAQNDFVILNPIEKAKEVVSELKSTRNNADFVIALTYLGYYPDDSQIGSKSLASAVNGIDIIIDGRTGLLLNEPIMINNTRICQAYKWGLFLGEIDLQFENKKLVNFKYQIHPVNYKKKGKIIGQSIEEDKSVLNLLKSKMYNYDTLIKKTIAVLESGELNPQFVSNQETEIGNLICDAMLDYSGADIAFQNAGGIGNKTIKKGEITRQSFDEIIKYNNTLFIVNMRGFEIKEILNRSVKQIGQGSFLQTGGINFRYSKSTQEFSQITIKDRLLDDSKFYKVVTNSWLAAGGDGYDIFRKNNNKNDLNLLVREAIYQYLEKKKKIEPYLDGRISITN